METEEETSAPAEKRARTSLDCQSALFAEHLCDVHTQLKVKRKALNIELVSRKPAIAKSEHDVRDCVIWERKTTDRYIGCSRMRAVRELLGEIDKRGFERSDAQERFHEAFLRSCSRVIYKEEWGVHEHAIREHNGWDTIAAGILISTPRRFGCVFVCFPINHFSGLMLMCLYVCVFVCLCLFVLL